MKKIVTIATIFLMVVMFATTIVSAATKDSLVDELYALTSKYGVTNADKIKADRFLVEYPITDEKANEILAKAKEAIKFLEDAGVTDVKKLETQLTKEQKLKFIREYDSENIWTSKLDDSQLLHDIDLCIQPCFSLYFPFQKGS